MSCRQVLFFLMFCSILFHTKIELFLYYFFLLKTVQKADQKKSYKQKQKIDKLFNSESSRMLL